MPDQKVSIIVPFYNTENYIEKCIQSLIEQTYTEIEMIFINDGSSDGSREIVARCQKKDARISIIDIENCGPAIARNAGLEEACGTYIMFCDSDDYYAKNMVATMVALIEEAQDIDLAMCSSKLANASASKRKDAEYFFNRRDGIYALTCYMKRQVNIVLWNKIFKKDLLRRYNINFTKLRTHEDENFVYKYLTVARKINFTSFPLYNYTYRDDSISEYTRVNPDHIGDYLSCFEDVLNFMKKHRFLERNQQYFSDALAHAAWLIDGALCSETRRRGDEETRRLPCVYISCQEKLVPNIL